METVLVRPSLHDYQTANLFECSINGVLNNAGVVAIAGLKHGNPAAAPDSA